MKPKDAPLSAEVIKLVQDWLNEEPLSREHEERTLTLSKSNLRVMHPDAPETMTSEDLIFRHVTSATRELVAVDQYGRRVGQDSGAF